MDQAQLEILIKLIADTSGATLTADQIDVVKQKMTAMGADGENAFKVIGEGSEQFAFRSQRHAQMAILAMAGLNDPLTQLAYHFEYLQMMADRTGMSIMDMLLKFAPMIGVVAVLGVAGKSFQEFGAIGKTALEEVGEADRGMIGDIEAGLSVLDLLNTKLEKTDDVAKNLAEHFARVDKNITQSIERAGHLDEMSQLKDQYDDIKERKDRQGENFKKMGDDLEAREKADTGLSPVSPGFSDALHAAAMSPAGQASIEQQLTKAGVPFNAADPESIARQARTKFVDPTAVIAASYDAAIAANQAGLHKFNADQETQLKAIGAKMQALAETTAGDKQLKDLLQEGHGDLEEMQGKARQEDDAKKEADAEVARVAKEKEDAEARAQEIAKRDRIAHLESIRDADTSTPQQKAVAEYEIIALQAQGALPGERDKLNTEYFNYVNKLDNKADAAANAQMAKEDAAAAKVLREENIALHKQTQEELKRHAAELKALRKTSEDHGHQIDTARSR